MKHFVLVYNRKNGSLLEQIEFPESQRATAIRELFEREGTYRAEADIEVVILSADSVDELKRTHTRYFRGELRKHVAAL